MQNAQRAPSPVNSKFTHRAAIVNTKLTAARVKQFRVQQNLSQQQFADLFRWSRMNKPYTRNYISMLERRAFPITCDFEINFYRVRAQLRAQPLERAQQNIAVEAEIITAFALPRRVHVLAAPRKCQRAHCPVCKTNRTKFFIPRTPNQRAHVLNTRKKIK